MEIEVHEPDGTITPVQQLIEQQKVLKEGGHVNLRIVERSRSFECGELVRFQPQELAEILVSVHTEARQLVSAMTRFAADKGVIIEEIVGDQGHP